MAPKRQGDVCKVCGQPRKPGGDMVLCAEHYRAYMREHATARNRVLGPEYQRIQGYVHDARAQGATEDEAWWIAMAAEIAFQRGESRPYWLAPFIAAELAWLRANAKVMADLDAKHQRWGVGGASASVVIDDGYDEEVA
jgi:hypothetical protein